MKVTKVLFVCLGNICRSPMAEAVLRAKAQEKDIALFVDSCGTANYHQGDSSDPRAIQVAQSKGYVMNHKARTIQIEDLNEFDYVFVMDGQNKKDVEQLAQNKSERKKIHYFGQYYQKDNPLIEDPYYYGKDAFEKILTILEIASENFLQSLEK